ncbi:hypothetical protein [Enterococcus faecalis]|uniref:hypothetical protein n=2 Tax=Enterococcus TaxID=1350 RepID=UPI0003AA8DB6|nr:hypothetical protein [Enterococcus faecalis]MDU5018985.1 hypothetical protein [Clostridiales bacterium]EJC3728751.1 hypothetical protein [Enterococcus faecalis]MBD9881817.1 hypothetical protein [Enterococcus faecalis]MDF4247899.1 hypothetical protein [Enterococcus faecalis]RTK82647.1 hypothetical protein DRJ71_13680 [Enterococcus faecalis]
MGDEKMTEEVLIPTEINLSLFVGKEDDLTKVIEEEVAKIKEARYIKPELLKIKVESDYRATYTRL